MGRGASSAHCCAEVCGLAKPVAPVSHHAAFLDGNRVTDAQAVRTLPDMILQHGAIMSLHYMATWRSRQDDRPSACSRASRGESRRSQIHPPREKYLWRPAQSLPFEAVVDNQSRKAATRAIRSHGPIRSGDEGENFSVSPAGHSTMCGGVPRAGQSHRLAMVSREYHGHAVPRLVQQRRKSTPIRRPPSLSSEATEDKERLNTETQFSVRSLTSIRAAPSVSDDLDDAAARCSRHHCR